MLPINELENLTTPYDTQGDTRASEPNPSELSGYSSGMLSQKLLKNLGPYELLDEIGEGSFSKIYKALDTRTENVVALKILQGKKIQRSQRIQERLISQEKIITEMDHPNILPVYAIAEYDEVPCISMKLVESGSLADRLADWSWQPSIRKLLDIVRQVADGLTYLHERGIIHRDIKPANLLLTFDDHVYVTDFGIAQVIERAYRGVIVGTPEYLAPEAIVHPENIETQVDIYSLGIVLFELFVGHLPFEAKSDTELLFLQVNQPIPSMGDIPLQISSLIEKCLSKQPDSRPATAQELSQEITQLLVSLPDETLARVFTHRKTSRGSSSKRITQVLEITTSLPVAPVAPVAPLSLGQPICPRCGTVNRPVALFCKKCSYPIAVTQLTGPLSSGQPICTQCGTVARPKARFCKKCGYPIAIVQSGYPPLTQNKEFADEVPQEDGRTAFAVLINLSGPVAREHFLIWRKRVAIGSGADNDVVVQDSSVSRQHALIVYESYTNKPGAFTLYDLASNNGTFVNAGQNPCTKRRLKHNDLITLGRVKLLFKRLDDNPTLIVSESFDLEAK